MIRLAFDIGGTFTDVVLHNSVTWKLYVAKKLTTTDDLSRAVLAGLKDVLDQAGNEPGDVEVLLHATTVATNAILQRQGAKTALLTTEGFRDILILGRQKRHETYDLYFRKPIPLAKRRNIYEVPERIDASGKIVTALSLEGIDRVVKEFISQGIESVAIVFLHSYANSSHERATLRYIEDKLPKLSISASYNVSPRIREYERTSTTVANAFVKPIVMRYLDGLETALQNQGFRAPLHVMQSNGGLVTPAIAREYPVRIVESGPAAGVLLASNIGRLQKTEHVITFDMGGTTAKLGVIDDGEPVITSSFEVDTIDARRYSGLPLSTPAIELLEIGAGGGSIASSDGHTIQVGPQSAGSDPGPVCYAGGGKRPTVTDANLVLGYLDPFYFNGGVMKLDVESARIALQSEIASPLALSLDDAAWGVHAVANANMERAMRVMSVEKGRDPRKYTLVAFGGAGPIHAARIARSLAIPRVIVPAAAGAGSAVGLLTAKTRIDATLTRTLELSHNTSDIIADIYKDLEKIISKDVERLDQGTPIFSRYAYLRQAGQGFEINVKLPEGPITSDYSMRVIDMFHETYERDYGYQDPASKVEGVDWCIAASFPRDESDSFRTHVVTSDKQLKINKVRQVYFPEVGGHVKCRVIDRISLSEMGPILGPVIIEDPESTIVALPQDRVTLSKTGDIVIDINDIQRHKTNGSAIG